VDTGDATKTDKIDLITLNIRNWRKETNNGVHKMIRGHVLSIFILVSIRISI